MVNYNPHEWFGLIFRFHKSDTFRRLFWVMISLAIYCWIIVYIEVEIFQMQYASTTIVHSLLGFVISLLLVFRTNTAYDRWWEGRKQWGALVNVSRNFSLKINAFIPASELRVRHELCEMTALYATVLRDHLRNKKREELVQLLPSFLEPSPEVKHIPNFLASSIQFKILQAYKDHQISEAAYLTMLHDINQFTDICGACERILKTPIPYNYNIFIKKFIFIYTITMPLGFVKDFAYWTIPIVVFTFYTLASLELIAEEIEDPFGTDADDLPTDALAETIYRNVYEIMT